MAGKSGVRRPFFFCLKGNGTDFLGFCGTEGGNGGNVLVVVCTGGGRGVPGDNSPGSGDSCRFLEDLESSGDLEARLLELRALIVVVESKV